MTFAAGALRTILKQACGPTSRTRACLLLVFTFARAFSAFQNSGPETLADIAINRGMTGANTPEAISGSAI